MIVYSAMTFSSPQTSGFDLLIFYLGFLVYDILFSWDWSCPVLTRKLFCSVQQGRGSLPLSFSLGEFPGSGYKAEPGKNFPVACLTTGHNSHVSENMGKWKRYSVDWKTPNLGSQYGKKIYAKKKHRKEIRILVILIVATPGGKIYEWSFLRLP